MDDASVARFIAAVGGDHADEPARARDIGPALDELLTRGKVAGVDLPDDVFLAYVAAKLGEVPSIRDALALLDPAELYLSCACERGVPAALARFEAIYFPVVELALAPMKLPVGTIDEVRQLVRTKLFVADEDEEPKIRKYAGRGTLEGLVRVIAVRTALTLQRRAKKEVPIGSSDVAEELLATAVAPELQIVKQRYRQDFKTAFERAIEELEPRDRMLLKLHVLDRASIDEIGALYKVHRATAARWLEAIRDKLGDRTRELLREKLAIDHSELESVVRVVQSQVDVSMARLLGR